MASSEVSVHPVQNSKGEIVLVDIDARGGTRRERGAAIGAAARSYGKPLRHYHTDYSETYGFLPATFTRYEIVS